MKRLAWLPEDPRQGVCSHGGRGAQGPPRAWPLAPPQNSVCVHASVAAATEASQGSREPGGAAAVTGTSEKAGPQEGQREPGPDRVRTAQAEQALRPSRTWTRARRWTSEPGTSQSRGPRPSALPGGVAGKVLLPGNTAVAPAPVVMD